MKVLTVSVGCGRVLHCETSSRQDADVWFSGTKRGVKNDSDFSK
jgi:hypothetical protein